MLRDEDRMMSHRRLPPVVRRRGRGQTLLDEVGGVIQDNRQPFATQVFKLSAAQAKATPERRFGERGEEFVKIASRHIPIIFPPARYTPKRSLIARTISSGGPEIST